MDLVTKVNDNLQELTNEDEQDGKYSSGAADEHSTNSCIDAIDFSCEVDSTAETSLGASVAQDEPPNHPTQTGSLCMDLVTNDFEDRQGSAVPQADFDFGPNVVEDLQKDFFSAHDVLQDADDYLRRLSSAALFFASENMYFDAMAPSNQEYQQWYDQDSLFQL